MLINLLIGCLIVALTAYCLGNLNGAILISRTGYNADVRERGSGNAGLTNFYRCFGKARIVPVIAIDILKAVVAVLVGGWLFRFFHYPALGMELAYLFVVVGHMFPAIFKFHGGKGILASVGALAVIDWRIMALLLATFLLIVLITRYVSLGSIVAAALIPVCTWFMDGRDPIVTGIAAALACLMIWMHRGNIVRLLRGEERKLTLSKK